MNMLDAMRRRIGIGAPGKDDKAGAGRNGALDYKIFSEKVALLYDSAARSQLFVAAAIAIAAYAGWESGVPRANVLAWTAIITLVTACRFLLGRRYRASGPRRRAERTWYKWFILAVACSGLAWGSAAVLLLPFAGPTIRYALILLPAGLVAAAVPYLAASVPAFVAFDLTALVPVAAVLLADAHSANVLLGAMIVVYVPAMIAVARHIHGALETAIALKYVNQDLIGELRSANDETARTNDALREEIAERRQIAAERERSLSLLRATLESTADGILVVDPQGGAVDYNRRFEDMWNLSQSVLATGDGDALLASMVPQLKDGRQFLARVREVYGDARSESYDLIEFTDGRVFERVSVPQRLNGETVGRVWSFRDITDRKRAEEHLNFVARHDDLTKLPNRSAFNERLALAVARAERHTLQLAVLFIDLDRFKYVNDTFGHDVGDKLLVEIGIRLKSSLRESDTIARLGGDEFVVLIEDVENVADAGVVADKIIQAVSGTYVIDGYNCLLTASVGISTYPSDGRDTRALLKHADIAMYRAKEARTGRYEYYASVTHNYSVERFAIESDLRAALGKDELFLEYQPKIDLASGELVGFEALVRWQHPERGLVRPDEFIPLAEETGLILQIGEWVLRATCQQLRRWQLQHLPTVPVAVNLSARQFARGDLVGEIDEILKETGVSGGDLEFEVTESAIMDNPEFALGLLQEIRGMGMQLAIDDFGIGYSSLERLHRLPISRIKIDQSFIGTLSGDGGPISRAVIELAHSLGLKALAEGVEDPDQVSFLRRHGCDEVQGFHFGKPMPPGHCAALMKGRSAGVRRTWH